MREPILRFYITEFVASTVAEVPVISTTEIAMATDSVESTGKNLYFVFCSILPSEKYPLDVGANMTHWDNEQFNISTIIQCVGGCSKKNELMWWKENINSRTSHGNSKF